MSDEVTNRLAIPVSDRDHLRGNPKAPLTLLEYGDFECDYCGRAYPVIGQLREHFGERLRFAFRNFPHSNIHPHASIAAQAAEATAAQGKFWEMYDKLYQHQDELAAADLTHYALRIGLELYKFQSDLDTERYAKKVADDYQGGVASGVKRTPTFFINGVRHDGPFDYETLKSAIEAADVK